MTAGNSEFTCGTLHQGLVYSFHGIEQYSLNCLMRAAEELSTI